jgi:Mg-chelatase subunit ChlD
MSHLAPPPSPKDHTPASSSVHTPDLLSSEAPSEGSEGQERLRRWRLILGGGDQARQNRGIDGRQEGSQPEPSGTPLLSERDKQLDEALNALYGPTSDDESSRAGDLGDSAPKVTRWLGDIRAYFPQPVVQVMQRDALKRLKLETILSQPELLNELRPDVHLVSQLISLSEVIPEETKESARQLVRQVVEAVMKRFREQLREVVNGSLNRSVRRDRPRHHEIDWPRTIRANLRHYQEEYQTIIPERRIGFGRKRSQLKEIIICLDQSGSMAPSLVYGAIFGAVLSSLPALSTRVVAFDTSVVDLTESVSDPVDLLFGVQLGGGTDINSALTYCHAQVTRPQDTTLILISDLCEGGEVSALLDRVDRLVASGVNLIALLALSDAGRPSYDHRVAEAFAQRDVPAFACTPDVFPDLIGVALQRGDLSAWAGRHSIPLIAPLATPSA